MSPARCPRPSRPARHREPQKPPASLGSRCQWEVWRRSRRTTLRAERHREAIGTGGSSAHSRGLRGARLPSIACTTGTQSSASENTTCAARLESRACAELSNGRTTTPIGERAADAGAGRRISTTAAMTTATRIDARASVTLRRLGAGVAEVPVVAGAVRLAANAEAVGKRSAGILASARSTLDSIAGGSPGLTVCSGGGVSCRCRARTL